MGIRNIIEDVSTGRTGDVLASGAQESASVYTYAFLPSATATGQISSAPVYLHTVTLANTAAAGSVLVISDTSSGAVADAVGSSASAAAIIDNGLRQTYLFDMYLSKGLAYRLSGIDCKGITITYQLA